MLPVGSPFLPVFLCVACNDLVASGRDRKPNALVQVAVIDPHKQHLVSHACTEIVEANKDPLFLTGVTFPSEYPASPETLVKLSVYDAKDKTQESVSKHFLLCMCVCSSFLGSATFSVGDLLRAKDERLTLSLRSSDGVCTAGTVVVSRLKMGEMEEVDVDQITTDIPSQKVRLAGCSFKPSCCKAQKSLEFIPINLHTQRMRVTCPKKTDAFYDIITVGAPAAHFQGFKGGGLHRLLSRYEAEKKSTAYQCIYYSPEHTAKAQEVLSIMSLLQPLITRLVDQLLQAAHEHSSPGLRDALKHLSDKTEQFVHTLKDELVKSALLALHAAQPGYVSKNQKSTPAQSQHQEPLSLKHQDTIPHHKEYDEEEWDRLWANVAKCLNCVIAMVDKLQEEDNTKQDPVPEHQLADVITSHNPGDWREQLCPLVTRLKDCVMEVVEKAKRAMTFVLLQEAACSIPQGFLLQQRRDIVFSQALAALACGFVMRLYAGMQDKGFLRQLHLVGLVAQFESLLSTYSEEFGMLEDMEVGISDLQRVMFKITEAKSDDLSDLQPLVCGRRDHFTVEVPLPKLVFHTLPEEIKEGKLLRVFPVLFNVGINEQQTIAERFGDISLQERINQKNFETLEAYYKSLSEKVPLECLPCFQTQTDIKELLETLGQNVVAKKKKNVEILWTAGTICRRLNGIRFTSCKSAKDRTSMSVTLEQCALLRDEHQLSKDFFVRALDCMRREGCRIENVQKNIKCRKYAFNMLQLMAFPKCYRPPEGTYGKVDS
uniref:phosphatidylinositol-3,4-bisphosphate 4-phosphatase n=1 Tax=Oreochromis niloticus TaxID=8128 RepID=A0A669DQG5_ORENI